jgi:hypothetical protein
MNTGDGFKIKPNKTTFYPSNSCLIYKEYFVNKRQTAGILIAAQLCITVAL